MCRWVGSVFCCEFLYRCSGILACHVLFLYYFYWLGYQGDAGLDVGEFEEERHSFWLDVLTSRDHHCAVTSPTGEIVGREGLSWHWAKLPWEGGDADEVKLGLLPTSLFFLSFFFSFLTYPLASWPPTKVLLSPSSCQIQCYATMKNTNRRTDIMDITAMALQVNAINRTIIFLRSQF